MDAPRRHAMVDSVVGVDVSRFSIALDKSGKIQAYQADHSGPPMQDDRPIGAVLAGSADDRSPLSDQSVQTA